jgi:hypothetical protein
LIASASNSSSSAVALFDLLLFSTLLFSFLIHSIFAALKRPEDSLSRTKMKKIYLTLLNALLDQYFQIPDIYDHLEIDVLNKIFLNISDI